MLQVFHFWLDYVDGFYLKGLEHIQIDSDVELHDILAQLRDLLNTKLTGETAMTIKDRKILICSSDFVQYRHKLMWNYGNSPLAFSNDAWSSSGSASIGVASEAFNALKHHGYINANTNTSRDIDIFSFFDLIDFQLSYQINKTETIRDQVNAIFLNAPKSFPWIHWNIGDVRTSRVASLIGDEYSLTSIFLLIMLPGTISVFYGDEIGLQNSFDTISHKVN
jgi:glycosidase